jgi:hypothetical protein
VTNIYGTSLRGLSTGSNVVHLPSIQRRLRSCKERASQSVTCWRSLCWCQNRILNKLRCVTPDVTQLHTYCVHMSSYKTYWYSFGFSVVKVQASCTRCLHFIQCTSFTKPANCVWTTSDLLLFSVHVSLVGGAGVSNISFLISVFRFIQPHFYLLSVRTISYSFRKCVIPVFSDNHWALETGRHHQLPCIQNHCVTNL